MHSVISCISGQLSQSRTAEEIVHTGNIGVTQQQQAGDGGQVGRDVVWMNVGCGVSFARSRQGQARRADWYRIPTKSEIYTVLGNARVMQRLLTD